jgi:hypothetical protein
MRTREWLTPVWTSGNARATGDFQRSAVSGFWDDVRVTLRFRTGVAALVACALVGALTACTPTSSVPGASPTPSFPSASASAAKEFPNGVTPVECDLAAQARPSDAAVALLADPTWRIGGWSHVNGVGSFATVAQPVGAYRISAENWLPDASCGGAKTLVTVLAKKTYDWDRQHANGMESSFPTENLTFGDVENLVLVVRFDPALSHVPSAGELAAAYGDVLSPGELAELDAGEVNLEFTLFGEGATADQPFMNAGALVAIDPAQAASGWVRVQIPREDLVFYTEENYERTEVEPDVWQELRVQGLRINPETASGKTVRNYLLDDFDVQAKPELFKEMALTFALIEVGHS